MGPFLEPPRGRRLAGGWPPTPWILALAALLWSSAAGAQQQSRVQVASSVSKVVVYSTQARVFRQARVLLQGPTQEVALADLPSGARHDTLRVECKTARVQRVEVIQARGRLPQQVKARELVRKIEALSDQLLLQQDERRILQSELRFISTLSLRQPVPVAGRREAEGLFAAAWKQILDWMGKRTGDLNTRLGQLAEQRQKLRKQLFELQVEARKLRPGTSQQRVPRVVARIAGKPGRHKVELSYRVSGVRWVPSYDLRYDVRSRTVEAAYYAVVKQTSGEDWEAAALRFSTGQPTRVVAIPELPTWTLGRKRDFSPTPSPRLEPAVARWSPRVPALLADPLMTRLAQLTRGHEIDRSIRGKDSGAAYGYKDKPRVTSRNAGPPLQYERMARKKRRLEAVLREKPAEEPADMDDAEAEADEPAPDMSKASPPPAPSPSPVRDPRPSMPAPRMALRAQSTSPAGASGGAAWSYRAKPAKPTVTLPWTDAGYRPPSLHPDLPAAAAKGYIFTLYAPGRHTVSSSGKQRRIPLLRRSLKVQPVYRLVPGRSKRAYLLATVRNTTGRPILRGNANLFSGAMFSGRSWLNTALPGHTIKLPLGVDEGIKVARHLRQKTLVKGVFFKDDVTEYTVSIEIANHHKRKIQVELHDQVPLEDQEKLEIKNISLPRGMTRDKKTGQLVWEGSVKGSAVKKLSFSFQIVRPKDWELRQHGG